MLNTPVNENLGLRFAVNYDHRDSFLRAGPNLNANLNPYKDNISARMTALLKFDRGELLLRGDYSHMAGISTNTLSTGTFYATYTTNTVYIANGVSSDRRRLAAFADREGCRSV